MGLKLLQLKIIESAKAVLPVSIAIFLLSIGLRIETAVIVRFLVGVGLLIAGLTLFSIGSVSSMVTIAESIGEFIVRKRNVGLFIVIAFLVGFMITVAEPALWVLAEQFQTVVSEPLLIATVALGVGGFLVLALLRILVQVHLRKVFTISYLLLLGLAVILTFYNPGFVPVAFDAGGVTTGPMAVPFIMALGLGISRTRGDKSQEEDSFGLVGIASIGPIMAVMILGFFIPSSLPVFSESNRFLDVLFRNLIQMAIAIAPFFLLFLVFKIVVFRLNKKKTIKILIALAYTYVGLVLFLTGAGFGLVDMGSKIGILMATQVWKWFLVPAGLVFGFLIVAAEPSVVALNRQVEEVTAGAISAKFMKLALSISVSVAIGCSIIRVLTGINILWILIPGYMFAISLSKKAPKMFTSIAFDSGGAVSGAMTSAFLIPFALGAATGVGSDVLIDAFGLVAFVALAPLITIQLLGIGYKAKLKKIRTSEDESEIMDLKEV